MSEPVVGRAAEFVLPFTRGIPGSLAKTPAHSLSKHSLGFKASWGQSQGQYLLYKSYSYPKLPGECDMPAKYSVTAVIFTVCWVGSKRVCPGSPQCGLWRHAALGSHLRLSTTQWPLLPSLSVTGRRS